MVEREHKYIESDDMNIWIYMIDDGLDSKSKTLVEHLTGSEAVKRAGYHYFSI